MADSLKLLDLVREAIRVRHYSIRTEKTYTNWIKQYIRFHNYTQPAELDAKAVEQCLTYLAVDRNVSASTQNQALSGILFLYQKVMEIDIDWIDDVVRAKSPEFPNANLTA